MRAPLGIVVYGHGRRLECGRCLLFLPMVGSLVDVLHSIVSLGIRFFSCGTVVV